MTDFKDPVNGGARYAVCVYDTSGAPQPLMQADVPPGRGWKPTASGFLYRSRTGASDGITVLRLKAGAAGKARVQAKGRGPNLNPPAPPLTLPVTVQLVIADDVSTECWQTSFPVSRKRGGVMRVVT